MDNSDKEFIAKLCQIFAATLDRIETNIEQTNERLDKIYDILYNNTQ